MITFKEYIKPATVEEAYVLCQKRKNIVIGGMEWVKMQGNKYNTAIDLCDLGLDYIVETADEFRIGAMATLSQIEKHEGLDAFTNGAVKEAVKGIVGVQFRNLATVGGSLYARFGFSDITTLFMALDARVKLFDAGELDLEEFAKVPKSKRDILEYVVIPKKPLKIIYSSLRNSKTDIPVLNCAVTEKDGSYSCVVGARPLAAALVKDEKNILTGEITEEKANAFAQYASEQLSFGSNMRAGAEYRERICKVFIRRAIMAMQEEKV